MGGEASFKVSCVGAEGQEGVSLGYSEQVSVLKLRSEVGASNPQWVKMVPQKMSLQRTGFPRKAPSISFPSFLSSRCWGPRSIMGRVLG